MRFERITIRPDQMAGLPCIRGLRIPVVRIIAMLADGMTEPEILDAYPDLEQADIRAALEFATAMLDERILPLAMTP
jgi:uncharacterized protein (DUF433 family)